ncbi:MAG: thymidine phosphorylase [Candidatus Sumerlaeaceae bacterium]
MRPVDLIIKKREGYPLTADEFEMFISAFVREEVADYQAAAFLMAAFTRGLDFEETAGLTRAMMNSGETYDLTGLGLSRSVDKHSTGGVGDKISLILAPLIGACGVPVPMVSGRGLGHTGGTLDKLESIPGFNVSLSREQFFAQLKKIGVAMIGQSDKFVPADKKLYALRDVTGTVESVPLICASIMSKKVASGAQALVMDVKCGSGAFMPTLERARELAHGLTGVGQALGRPVRALITDMNQPLGKMIGNSLEVIESIDCMKGGGPADVRELTLELAAEMLILGDKALTHQEARTVAEGALDSGEAWQKFREMVQMQGGDVSFIDDPAKLDVSTERFDFAADTDGYLTAVDCRGIGNAAVVLGAGREKTTDDVDYGVGFEMHVRIGDEVKVRTPLITIYHRGGPALEDCKARLRAAFTIGPTKAEPRPLVLERV